MSTDRPPVLSSLDNVRVGDTREAKLVEALLRSAQADYAESDSLRKAITLVAHRCVKNEWTVYRWLRGIAAPPRAALAALERLAHDRGVPLEPVPAEGAAPVEGVEDAPPAA